MKMRESKFGAPAGVYQARFEGLKLMEAQNPPRLGRDGRPMPPGMEWQFTVLGGEQDGQVIGRITGTEPTTKNSCGMLLSGMFGRAIQPDEDLDPNQFRGQTFEVVVGRSKDDPNKTYIIQINGPPRPGITRPPAAAPSALPPRPVGPVAPPAPKSSAAIKDAPPERYWIDDDGNVSIVTADQVRNMVTAMGVAPEKIILMTEDKASGWKTAAEFGLHSAF